MEKILAALEKLPVEALLELKERIEELIKTKFGDDLGRRSSRRARVRIAGTAEIEREAEFFYKVHKVSILEMSVNGLVFRTTAPVIHDDLLAITFRSPSSGEKKLIHCQVVRIQEFNTSSGFEHEVAAKAVDKNVVREYREMLKKRGR